MSRIVFAYSGSARSSIAIRWMIEAWQAEVVTLTLDLGQRDELDAVRERALACGALRAHVLDERESFARDYLLKALRAGAASEEGRPLGRLLTRPLIAKQLVDVARMEGVSEVAHGAWRDADDRARFERAMRDAATGGPEVIVRAPLVDADMTDAELLAFAEEHDLPVERLDAPRALEANLWERCSAGAASLAASSDVGASEAAFSENPSEASLNLPSGAASRATAPHFAASEAATSSATSWPAAAAVVAIEFSRGTPVGLNGVAMPLLEIMSSLDTIAEAHGIGRTQQLVRLRDEAIVSQRCDAPAAALLDVALQQLQRLAMPADVVRDVQRMSALYRDILFRGAWGGASRRGCDAFVDGIHARVTGTVRLRLLNGTISVMDCAFADDPTKVAQLSR
jgi:argininosuccinate synthase